MPLHGPLAKHHRDIELGSTVRATPPGNRQDAALANQNIYRCTPPLCCVPAVYLMTIVLKDEISNVMIVFYNSKII